MHVLTWSICMSSVTIATVMSASYHPKADACVHPQELVGFLTESAEHAEDPDDFQVSFPPALEQTSQ